MKLLNGSHTLKIVAADNYGGSATRTYTFTKNETEIELMLATPLAADDMVTKGIMSVVRQIPVARNSLLKSATMALTLPRRGRT